MTWLLRSVFVVILLAGLVWKWAAPIGAEKSRDPVVGITSVLGNRLSGPVARERWGRSSEILTAPVRGCAQPLTIVTTRPSFLAVPALMQIQGSGRHHLFAHLDWVSAQPDRWLMLRRRVYERALAMTGLTPYISSDVMLFIAEPDGCQVAEASLWQTYWLKSTS